MEYNFGNLIKIERMRKNMKQSVLARGICSISYLSKIENNQTSPSDGVLELIFKRLELEVPLYYDFSEKVDQTKKEIRDILKEALLSRQEEKYFKKIEKFKTNPVVLQSKELYITLLITLARFGITPGGNIQYLIEVGWIKDQLKSDDRIRYDLVQCIYMFLYQSADRNTTVNLLENVGNKISSSSIPDWEKADMYYVMGALYHRFRDYSQAIEYVKIALEYFQENFCLERIIESHMIIGLSFKRRKRYTVALEHYEKAAKVADKANLKDYYGMLYNNMGDIYFLVGDQEKAQKYFLDSYHVKEGAKSKLYSVMSLLEVSVAQDNVDAILKWLESGYELKGNQNELVEFNYHFDIYVSKYQKNNQYALIESLKKAVEYFEAYDEYYTHKYALWLSRELRNTGKYKLATEYYEKTISMMSRWE
ncbi:helix-turn-helix transcriptional regulator [Exiguobacterium aestuarii]|uniref:helix-turn-helix transcriptional regulator n=1 Tax=Exiguobacterium aestuarii TaxID=273527 RepID=UPI001CD1B65A|nr:helix-turn-helix transcriptional regulator [Exiguobacterium aestuarii]MCA0982285.1 helix-turn-helix transcriptional regulator [Exiguobacterium aestuarii]